MQPGSTTAGYRLVRMLGRGARASVWEAVAEVDGRRVALKVLHDPLSIAPESLIREYQTQRRLRHPNVVGMVDLVEIEERLALAAELVDGTDLKVWLERHRPDHAEAIRLFGGVLRGLAAAHALGFVHRDLKPSNVLLTKHKRPTPKISDFGVVKIDGEGGDGQVLGTWRYMAPEQIVDARAVDARADLFSAGCLFYELLTGNRAFDAPNRVAMMNAIRSKQHGPIPPDLDPRVAAVLDALLDPDPDKRPASAAAALEALGLPLEPEAEPPEEREVSAAPWTPVLAGVIALGALALAGWWVVTR